MLEAVLITFVVTILLVVFALAAYGAYVQREPWRDPALGRARRDLMVKADVEGQIDRLVEALNLDVHVNVTHKERPVVMRRLHAQLAALHDEFALDVHAQALCRRRLFLRFRFLLDKRH